ncbi:MAG: YfiR family protein [Burkholderiaceae bacterium]|nr:YfiR family protein [Burkholderiaceae bacterium]
MRLSTHPLRTALSLLGMLLFAAAARGADLPEYRLKAAFLYNFAVYTEWPAEVGNKLNLCVLGQDPFDGELQQLSGKVIGTRSIAVQNMTTRKSITDCQLLYIAPSAIGELPLVLGALNGLRVLVVTDSPGAARDGAAINMAVQNSKILFEVNLKAVQDARLTLSSKLLRLAREIYP